MVPSTDRCTDGPSKKHDENVEPVEVNPFENKVPDIIPDGPFGLRVSSGWRWERVHVGFDFGSFLRVLFGTHAGYRENLSTNEETWRYCEGDAG